MSEGELNAEQKTKKSILRQTDVPAHSIKDALRVARVLSDSYAKAPTKPLMVAKAMGVSPTTGGFRMITGASVAYELTEGGAQSATAISLTPLGRRIVAPTDEGDDLRAIKEAIMKPRVISEFLTKYNNSKLPAKNIALNVLEEMGVPSDVTDRAYDMILENAEYAGVLEDVNGAKYVNLESTSALSEFKAEESSQVGEVSGSDDLSHLFLNKSLTEELHPVPVMINTLATNKRVFISHGKNRDIVAQLREVLGFGGFEPVVSVDKEATAMPVPDKVMDDMRSCGAGIVNVGTDQTITDVDGNEHKFLNQNVLIEIGAALALYKRNFILLVESGVELPTNLRGLYEVRYSGKTLDYDATMKLLKAFNEIKTNTIVDA
jgi:predicted nucleotide-binding protein